MNVQDTTHNEMPAIPTLVGRTPGILEDICLLYRFDVDSLAFIAEIEVSAMLDMLEYKPVHKKDAKKVLTVLSELTEQEYTFENVDVPLIEEAEVKEGKEANGEAQIL